MAVSDAEAKMNKVKELNAAIDRTMRLTKKGPGSYEAAVSIQDLMRQRQGIMATFPGIRLVKTSSE